MLNMCVQREADHVLRWPRRKMFIARVSVFEIKVGFYYGYKKVVCSWVEASYRFLSALFLVLFGDLFLQH